MNPTFCRGTEHTQPAAVMSGRGGRDALSPAAETSAVSSISFCARAVQRGQNMWAHLLLPLFNNDTCPVFLTATTTPKCLIQLLSCVHLSVSLQVVTHKESEKSWMAWVNFYTGDGCSCLLFKQMPNIHCNWLSAQPKTDHRKSLWQPGRQNC